MRIITVLVVGILFFASVDATGNTLEIKEAQISGEKDAEGPHWKWFTAGYFIIHATPMVLMSAHFVFDINSSDVDILLW